MNTPNNRPSDVLREFTEDVKLAYGTGDGDELDRTALRDDWPDLLVTYNHALAALESNDRAASARHVVVHVEGGVVSDVTTPADVVVEVRIYNVDGIEEEHLHIDNDGRPHTVEWWGDVSDSCEKRSES